MDALAPTLVGDADDRDLRDVRMQRDRVFDLGGKDLLAARSTRVLHPFAAEKIAAFVAITRLAAMQPAIGPRRAPLLRLVTVTQPGAEIAPETCRERTGRTEGESVV